MSSKSSFPRRARGAGERELVWIEPFCRGVRKSDCSCIRIRVKIR